MSESGLRPEQAEAQGVYRGFLSADMIGKLIDRDAMFYWTFTGGCLAFGSEMFRRCARVGAICRISITPKSHPLSIPYPLMKKAERIAGREGRYAALERP